MLCAKNYPEFWICKSCSSNAFWIRFKSAQCTHRAKTHCYHVANRGRTWHVGYKERTKSNIHLPLTTFSHVCICKHAVASKTIEPKKPAFLRKCAMNTGTFRTNDRWGLYRAKAGWWFSDSNVVAGGARKCRNSRANAVQGTSGWWQWTISTPASHLMSPHRHAPFNAQPNLKNCFSLAV